jgi:hypothetical protein
MQYKYTGSDRRKHNRVKRALMARMRIYKDELKPQASQKWDIVQIRNLGSGGLSFNYTEEIALGTVIEFNIMAPSRPEPIHCLGRVCRIDEASPELTEPVKKITVYGIAIRFIK